MSISIHNSVNQTEALVKSLTILLIISESSEAENFNKNCITGENNVIHLNFIFDRRRYLGTECPLRQFNSFERLVIKIFIGKGVYLKFHTFMEILLIAEFKIINMYLDKSIVFTA